MKPKQKKTFKFRVTKLPEATNAKRHIDSLDLSKKWLITVTPYKKDRSVAQNRLLYAYIASIAKQSGNGFQNERNTFKFTLGCPILLEDGETEFAKFYDQLINTLTYEQCVDAMQFISVSSQMKVKQFIRYLTAIEQSAFERGFYLEEHEDYAEAMGVKR